MGDNVILLGAGASLSAGIPLLGNFIDEMWRLAKLGHHDGAPLSDSDRQLLTDALKVREELDCYHGRVALNVWNIEDILSILSFNALAGGSKERQNLGLVARAIAKTIELTCAVHHSGKLNEPATEHNTATELYDAFWQSLIAWVNDKDREPPVIITFNYDLVLERSLLRTVIGQHYWSRDRHLPRKGLILDYHTSVFDRIKLGYKEARFLKMNGSHFERMEHVNGWILDELPTDHPEGNLLPIDLIKLHGSANFARKRSSDDSSKQMAGKRLVTAVDDPLILPPVFNKATETVGTDAWAFAVNALRQCKNLIICGYSLPQTDIYMQYFLKAALGPNQDLNRVFVFDPVLFGEEQKQKGDELRQRYSANFSVPLQSRISFQPPTENLAFTDNGTMTHLVRLLGKYPDTILFG